MCPVLGKASHISLQGYLFGLLSAFLSALAAVYTEWVMKRNNDSLYWQNIQLYTFGVIFNGLGLTVNNLRSGMLPLISDGKTPRPPTLPAVKQPFCVCAYNCWAVRAGFQEGIWLTSIFRGYNLITFAVVANLAFSGLLVSWVMKFADSIMKVALPLCLATTLLQSSS